MWTWSAPYGTQVLQPQLDVTDDGEDFGESGLALKFGPSGWFAKEQDPRWRRTVDRATMDYSRLFLSRAGLREIRQTAVTLHEVLCGLQPDDRRPRDEIVELWRDPTRESALSSSPRLEEVANP